MVKELEITDWEPFEIAEMIQGEISALLPHWQEETYDTINYKDNEDNDGPHHPLYSFSSSSLSQASISGMITSHGIDQMANSCDWFQGMMDHHVFLLLGNKITYFLSSFLH